VADHIVLFYLDIPGGGGIKKFGVKDDEHTGSRGEENGEDDKVCADRLPDVGRDLGGDAFFLFVGGGEDLSGEEERGTAGEGERGRGGL